MCWCVPKVSVCWSGGQKLIASLKSVSRAETIEIEISRVTARPKASRRKVRAARSYRMANAEVRYKRVELPDPRGKAAALSLYGVHVRETNPPGGQNPLEWVLLTSIKLHNGRGCGPDAGLLPEEVAH